MRKPNSDLKYNRILGLYNKLIQGEVIDKEETALQYNVNPRSIQRDIDDLRMYFSDRMIHYGEVCQVVYDRKLKGYRLDGERAKEFLTAREAFAVCKILLESRSMVKEEIQSILSKLVDSCKVEKERRELRNLIANESCNYVGPHHKKPLLENLWELGCAVENQRYLMVTYKKMGNQAEVRRLLKPVGIMFSEFYFYLTAYIEAEEHKNDEYPTIYRVDRITSFTVRDDHFTLPYAGRFQEGEFRKRIQFMYGGKLKRVRFEYRGPSIEAVMDRFPAAEIRKTKEGVYEVMVECFGEGIQMWLGSQGDWIKILGES